MPPFEDRNVMDKEAQRASWWCSTETIGRRVEVDVTALVKIVEVFRFVQVFTF